MKKIQKRLLIVCLCLIAFLTLYAVVFASEASNSGKAKFSDLELSKEFVEYLELSDEERAGVYAPRMFDTKVSSIIPNNQLKIMRTTNATYDKEYSLRDTIPNNLEIRDQKVTQMCWAFASMSSLETNLALSDYFNKRAEKIYDFSERHMEYSTVRKLNGGDNEFGFNRKIDSGGNSGNTKIDISYLTNGMGAINEEDMPFSMDMRMQDISYIKNKEVQTQVYDIVEFEKSSPETVNEEYKNKMKNHIKNYGSINTYIWGAIVTKEYDERNGGRYYGYNNQTGAIYCNPNAVEAFPMNHAVSIIGWDDEYSIENFNEHSRPKNPGAWIIRNSWGTGTFEYEEMRQFMFDFFTQTVEGREALEQNNLHWESKDDISDQLLEKWASDNDYEKKSNNTFYSKIGDDGIMYVSYEDKNIYSNMTGVQKAENEVSYDYIYQYDEMGATYAVNALATDNTIWVGNIYSKKTEDVEYLTQVSIYAPDNYTCKVWVNPNGSSSKKSDLVEVKLKEGNSETFEPGYHTIEFANSVELNSDEFFVALEIHGDATDNYFPITIEGKWKDTYIWGGAHIESGKCFTGYLNEGEIVWNDVSAYKSENGLISGADTTLKAFTTTRPADDSVSKLEITKQPAKTEYWENENFDKTGMEVTAHLYNGEKRVVEDYIIKNGEKLSSNQKSVTIEYEGKTVEQPITVSKNTVESIEIKSNPTTTTYKAGDDFKADGLVLTVTFKNGTTKDVTDFEILDGNDLKNGQTVVNVKYGEKTKEILITVNQNLVEKIEIIAPPNKTEYVEGQDFNRDGMKVKATYEDGTEKEVTSYTVEDGVKLTKDQTDVTIKFEDKTVKQEITVKGKSAVSISIKTKPNKVKYMQYDEELSLEGGIILVRYNDGSSEEISMTASGVTAQGFDNTKPGKSTVKVKYLNCETSFEVEIEEKIEELPENSDFSKATAKNKLMKMYYFTNNSEKEYSLIDVEISEIKKATVNDSLSYEYCLSSNQAANAIDEKNWIPLNIQINDGKLKFTINTKDVKNYDEISKANNLYLYIRETATRKEQTKKLVVGAKDISKTEKKEEYIDGIKKENQSGGSQGGSTSGGDGSQATGKYPYTGKVVIAFAVITLVVMGTFGLIRYKNIDK